MIIFWTAARLARVWSEDPIRRVGMSLAAHAFRLYREAGRMHIMCRQEENFVATHKIRSVRDKAGTQEAPRSKRVRQPAGTAGAVLFSASEIGKFRRVHQWLVKQGIQPPRRRRVAEKTDDDVVVDLVCQVAVIGNSAPGKKVRKDPGIAALLRWRDNLELMSRARRIRAIHRVLKLAGVRYAGESVETCRYSGPLADSLQTMRDAGGPSNWVKEIAALKAEGARLRQVRTLPIFKKGQKSPRDFLSTKLGLARNLIALDDRILAVLRAIAPAKFGETRTPQNASRYEAIERGLVEQVCPALGVSGYQLDQFLYLGNDKGAIVKYLRGDSRPASVRKLPEASASPDRDAAGAMRPRTCR